MKTKIFIIAVFCQVICLGGFSQDFHLTQYDVATQYFNPALTGNYFGDNVQYKIYSDYRSQWRSLGTKPYATFYLAGDMPYSNWGKDFGVGGYIIHNRNGRGGLNTLNVMPSASYNITGKSNGPHALSVGLQMGILYKSYDPNSFTYDSQYNGNNGFDQNMSSGETFSKTSLLKFDANMGVFYKFKKAEWKAQPWGGFSVFNVTRPNLSLTGIEKDKLPMRWAFRAGADYTLNDQITLHPMILYMNQAKAYEFNIGSLGFYKLKETKYEIIGGLNYRWKDAFIIQAGMRYDQHIFKISYDINTSYLNNYTNGRGGFEFGIVLSGISGKPLFNAKFLGGGGSKKSL